jgi:hypothetical protein
MDTRGRDSLTGEAPFSVMGKIEESIKGRGR